MYSRNYTKEPSRFSNTLLALSVIFVVITPLAFVHVLPAMHTMDKEVGSHMDLAAGAGSPTEMAYHLEQAQEGLDDVGYSGGQYAYFWKTPASNTEVQREVLQSYIERAHIAANAENDTHQSNVFMDLRRGLTGPQGESGWGIDTLGEWAHDNPLNYGAYVVVMMAPITITGLLGGLFYIFVYYDEYAEYYREQRNPDEQEAQ